MDAKVRGEQIKVSGRVVANRLKFGVVSDFCRLYKSEYRDEIHERLKAAIEPQRPDMNNPSFQTISDPTAVRLERQESINSTMRGMIVRAIDVELHKLKVRYSEEFADAILQAICDGRHYNTFRGMERQEFKEYIMEFKRSVIKESGL